MEKFISRNFRSKFVWSMVSKPGGGHLGKLIDGYVRWLRVCFSRKQRCTVRVDFLINADKCTVRVEISVNLGKPKNFHPKSLNFLL